MRAKNNSQRILGETNFLVLNKRDIQLKKFKELDSLMKKGDLIIYNKTATLPSNFFGTIERTNEEIEIRLAAHIGKDERDFKKWKAISFQPTRWTVKTDEKANAPELKVNDIVKISPNLRLKVLKVDKKRILTIEFKGEDFISEIYKYGKPIQYSYHQKDLELWDQQTIFSSIPVSVEPNSASFQFTWEQYIELTKKGVEFVDLLHSAGISSTGSKSLDRKLPLEEFYLISKESTYKIRRAKENGNKIILLGTSALRALESLADRGDTGHSRIKIDKRTELNFGDALITGIHEFESSHMRIIENFCTPKQIKEGYEIAEKSKLSNHEYGDLLFLNCRFDGTED